ncbi:MAG: hypothetical protein WAO15_12415 [Mycobacterium sp.]
MRAPPVTRCTTGDKSAAARGSDPVIGTQLAVLKRDLAHHHGMWHRTKILKD